ncbi:tripartite tricarboxylate transporter substrate binding protein [Variovorax robiniae]|uniref:Tripartite tricarboxylate transporter substrate binding protein n=1 Tax=Variovorax robiniae TaxID=1836199 RepID=A0ABU8XGQ9_9BURK
MHRRRLLQQLASGAAAGLLGSIGTFAAHAQTAFPGRAVRVIVPFPPGGSSDVIARLVCERLAKAWGQPVIVDNRPGATGMIGASTVAKAAPDGLTLLMTVSALVQAPSLYAKASYDPIRDFAPISELASAHVVLVAGPELPVRQVKDLPAHVAKLGHPLTYGTYGQGSSAHLQMEIFARVAKLPLVHVPYKGENPLINELLGGQVALGTISAAAAAQHARTGRIRPLAVMGSTRSPLLTDMPTFGEAGFAGLERDGWFGLFAPAGTPAAIVEQISRDANGIVADPALRRRMAEIGIVFKGTSPAAFAELLKVDQAYWAQAIRDANVKLD